MLIMFLYDSYMDQLIGYCYMASEQYSAILIMTKKGDKQANDGIILTLGRNGGYNG